jgi:hypothetical protein
MVIFVGFYSYQVNGSILVSNPDLISSVMRNCSSQRMASCDDGKSWIQSQLSRYGGQDYIANLQPCIVESRFYETVCATGEGGRGDRRGLKDSRGIIG